MTSSEVLFCIRCKTDRMHERVEWAETAGANPGDALGGLANDMLNTVTFGISNRMLGHPYKCETCGHYRSTHNQCETKGCWH